MKVFKIVSLFLFFASLCAPSFAQQKIGFVSSQAIIALLPAMKRPTLSTLVDDGWVALETILLESQVRAILPSLKEAGAADIIEYPLSKVIY